MASIPILRGSIDNLLLPEWPHNYFFLSIKQFKSYSLPKKPGLVKYIKKFPLKQPLISKGIVPPRAWMTLFRIFFFFYLSNYISNAEMC